MVISYEQCCSTMYSVFTFDVWYPPYVLEMKKEFRRECYRQWIIEELERYLKSEVFYGDGNLFLPVSDVVKAIRFFNEKITEYSRMNSLGKEMFSEASNFLANDVIDVFIAMV